MSPEIIQILFFVGAVVIAVIVNGVVIRWYLRQPPPEDMLTEQIEEVVVAEVAVEMVDVPEQIAVLATAPPAAAPDAPPAEETIIPEQPDEPLPPVAVDEELPDEDLPATDEEDTPSPPAASRPPLTLEIGLYLLILIVALALRLAGLGDAPLQPGEAETAVAAWRFASGDMQTPLTPASGLLFTLMSATFWMFGSSEAQARLWPALAGSLVALGPFFFRRKLGRPVALLFAVLLAISPTMVAVSRTADSTTLVWLSLLLVAVGLSKFLDSGEQAPLWWVAVGFGLGFTAGPGFVTGLLVAILGWGVGVYLLALPITLPAGHWNTLRLSLPRMALLFALTVFVLGSAMLVYAPGLTAVGASLPAWLAGWGQSATTSPLLTLELGLLYEPFTILFALVGLWFIIEESRPARLLLTLALFGGLFSALYAGRTPADTLWLLIPLTGLVACILIRIFQGRWLQADIPLLVAQAGVLLVLLVLSWLSMASHAVNVDASIPLNLFGQQIQITAMFLSLLAIGLAIIVAILFAVGWPPEIALRAFTIAVGIVFILAQVSNLWTLNYVRPANPRELWYTGEVTISVSQLLPETLADISNRETGRPDALDLVVLDDPAGPLAWQLRHFDNARFVEALDPSIITSVVITDEFTADPILGSAYLGQTLALLAQRAEEPAPETLVRYLVYRDPPLTYHRRVIWVREDVHQLPAITQP